MPKDRKDRPKTGDPRITRQPLGIDALPPSVHEAIKFLRSRGLGWMEIERLSALPYGEKWAAPIGSAGFVDWEQLPLDALEKFPLMRIPHTNLHRWYDLRVEQVKTEVLHRAEQAREIAEVFAAAGLDDADGAVLNAARDLIFGMLQATDDKTRSSAAKALISLGEVMQSARANDIKERRVAVDERRVKQLERVVDQKMKVLDRETQAAANKLKSGVVTIEDLNRLRERTFGLPPVAAHG